MEMKQILVKKKIKRKRQRRQIIFPVLHNEMCVLN